jgi:hypothetical protein
MHNFRHPAAPTLAFVLFTVLALASLAGRASANGNPPNSSYPALLSWPSTPEDIGLPRREGQEAQ